MTNDHECAYEIAVVTAALLRDEGIGEVAAPFATALARLDGDRYHVSVASLARIASLLDGLRPEVHSPLYARSEDEHGL
jgi:hypothetical protein